MVQGGSPILSPLVKSGGVKKLLELILCYKKVKKKLLMNWKILESNDQLNNLIETSYQKPQAIYKHSIRCVVSSVTKSRLERKWDLGDNDLDIYFLDLINHKQLSNSIEETFGVYHQSPQILLIINGNAVYHTSHMGISADHLKKALTSAA